MITLILSGCASIGYYAQSVHGQFDVWRRARVVAERIDDPATPLALRERLVLAARLRDFASRELALPDNASYRRYADLERSHVVWNVFATQEFSVQPVQWCFPFAGCVNYRGYFSKQEADRYAQELAAGGHDVHVSGVPAYSTLGWFADPLLNTFIHYPGTELARLLFHELAHQVVYVRDDTAFNESFATAVEQAGVRRWLARHGTPQAAAAFEAASARREAFRSLMHDYRRRLAALYRMRLAPDAMRERKARVFDAMQRDYLKLKDEWGGFAGYDPWFAQRPNNAHVAAVTLYASLVPQFEALFERVDGDFRRFYDAVRALAALPREERAARLAGR